MGKKQKAVGARKMKGKELISKLSSAKTIEKKKSTENKKIDSPLKNVEKKKVVKILEKKKVMKSEEKKGKKADTPKLPCQTVYFLYYAERVRELKKENVKISAAIRRQIGKDWEAMTPDEQKPYFVRANEAKESNKKAKRQLSEDVCHNVRKKMKTEEYSIKTRLSLKSIAKAIQNLTDDQLQAVKEIGFGGATWCVCKDGVGDANMQKTLDYACGAGADCTQIHQNGACYNPNTLKAHCSYAVNSYFQKKGQAQGTCDFAGTASVSPSDPSTTGCAYPTSASGTTPVTTPTGLTPTTTTPTGVGGSPFLTPSNGVGTGLGPSGTGINNDFSHGVPTLQKTSLWFSFLMTLLFSGFILLRV